MLRSLAGLGLSLLVACGGSVVVPDGSSVGGSSSSSGSDTSNGGGGSNRIGCAPQTIAGDRACVPGTAQANVLLTLTVDSRGACQPCAGGKLTPCQVTVSGTSIVLSMQMLACFTDGGCGGICDGVSELCPIPPLPAGTYTVDVDGADETRGFEPRQLVVTDDATDISCTLPRGGASPDPLDAKKYATACNVESDCTTVLTGDVCSACGCANTAISVRDEELYESDYRAASSQCGPSLATPCPPCVAFVAHCVVAPDALVGTCVATSP